MDLTTSRRFSSRIQLTFVSVSQEMPARIPLQAYVRPTAHPAQVTGSGEPLVCITLPTSSTRSSSNLSKANCNHETLP